MGVAGDLLPGLPAIFAKNVSTTKESIPRMQLQVSHQWTTWEPNAMFTPMALRVATASHLKADRALARENATPASVPPLGVPLTEEQALNVLIDLPKRFPASHATNIATVVKLLLRIPHQVSYQRLVA